MAAVTSAVAAVATAASAVKGAREASKARKDAKKAQEESIAIQKEAIESLRSPQEIIDDLFGPDGLFTEGRLKNIAETDQRVTDTLLELQRAYGEDVVYGEGGILEAAEQGTERALERIRELGPEFRAALEDPRTAMLVEDQIDRYNKTITETDARAAEREEAAANFEAATVGAIEGAQADLDAIRGARTDSARPFLDTISGISGEGIRGIDTTGISGEGIRGVGLGGLGGAGVRGVDTTGIGAVDLTGLGSAGVRGVDISGVSGVDTSGLGGAGVRGVDFSGVSGFDTSSLRDFDLSNLKNLSFEDLKNLDLTQSSGFLGDIRGLTDIETAEAERLTEAARGPLGFEAIRRAEQAARAEGGALGRQLDASAVARAALGREEAVMAREDRAAAARARAAEMAGLGAKLGLSQETLKADAAQVAAKLGLSKEELVSKLGLSAEEAAMGFDFNAQELAAKLKLSQAEIASKLDIAAAETQLTQQNLASQLGLTQEELAAKLDISAAEANLTQQELMAKLDLTQEELASKLDITAAELELAQERAATAADVTAAQTAIDQERFATAADLEAAGLGAQTGIELDKLNLAKSELAAGLGIDLAKLNSILAAGARQEGLTFRQEGRGDFETTFDAARAASVDPSEIFLREQGLGTAAYTDIISGTPSTVSTDIGAMINYGSAEDARRAGISGGMSEILAAQGLGASQRSSDYFDTIANLLGSLGKYGQTTSAFRTPSSGTVNPNSFSINLFD